MIPHTLGECASHGFRRVGFWIRFEVGLGSRPDDLGFDVYYRDRGGGGESAVASLLASL